MASLPWLVRRDGRPCTGVQGQALDPEPGFKVYGDGADLRSCRPGGCTGLDHSLHERIGLASQPARTGSGYRDYDDVSATRLLFVSRARRLGISREQIAELLPVWSGANCRSAHQRVSHLIDEKQAEIAARIQELGSFEPARRRSAVSPGILSAGRLPHRPHLLRADGPPTWYLEVQPALRANAAKRTV